MNTELIDDESDVDYSSFYNDNTSVQGSSSNTKGQFDKTRTGQVLDMMNKYNLGTTLFCLIPDRILTDIGGRKLPRLFRKISYGYTGRIIDPDNPKYYMNIRIPRVEEFKANGVSLTKDQWDLVVELRKQSQSFGKFTSFNNRKYYGEILKLLPFLQCPAQTVTTYGKVIRVISSVKGEVNDETIGHVRILKFTKGEVGKSDFITSLQGAISNKSTAFGSNAWMKEWFNRKPGIRNKLVSCNISQPAVSGIKKYSISTTLEEVAPFEITDEDLNVADNLNAKVFNITEFEDEYYNKLARAYEIVQSKINELSSSAPQTDPIPF